MSQLWGFADTHLHLMAHLGYGLKIFWGEPFHANGISGALPSCEPVHGPGGIFRSTEMFHATQGYPKFDGWPRFTSTLHQQVYVDWIERAYQGGLRLISCLVTNNELLAERTGVVEYADDKTAIERQIQYVKDMVRFVDSQNGGPGKGWMQIALSPAEARGIVEQGKLALVLGIEVDSLGNWKTPDDLPRDLRDARAVIAAELDRLYGLGVRQITPVHVTDNAFAGCAIYNRFFDAVNQFVTGSQYVVANGWDSGVRYRLDQDGLDFVGMVQLSVGYRGRILDVPSGPGSHVNVRGLTAYGRILLEEMMRLGMVIDVDHMSEKATDETLTIAESENYPVISSHSGFRELAFTGDVPFVGAANRRAYGTSVLAKIAHESLKRPDQIERIRNLGGLVAPILLGGDNRDVGSVVPGLAGRVPNDCAGSSKTWAQNYLYAVEKMGGKGVALGSDFGGLIRHPGPRFGTFAAFGLSDDRPRAEERKAQAAKQTNGVRYDSPIIDYRAHRFEPGALYNDEERDIWEAIAIYKSGTDPDTADQPLLRTAKAKIVNIAKGFKAEREEDLLQPGTLTGNSPWEQRAAFLVRHNRTPTLMDKVEVQRLYAYIKPVWDKWHDMEGSNRPLTRSVAGRRDFDINIDGLAHYGLLPDFIQDLRNVGLNDQDLEPLFRSAEDYIQMWEDCTRTR